MRHRIIFGDSRDMSELAQSSVHLVVTSPPYYNAPFDYPGLFSDYNQFLNMFRNVAKEIYRVLAPGRIAALVTDDMLVNGQRYPIVSDVTRIMLGEGFRYRDKIIWVKPKGYTRISRRSGVVVQHPYPMYFYPDNIQESILIFQKGKFNYANMNLLHEKDREASRIPLEEYNEKDWYITVWHITNVLPVRGRIEEGVAAYPDEIPRRLIRLFSFVGETVLDPFLGSGTTVKVANDLRRNSVGYELDLELENIIQRKLSDSGMKVDKLRFIRRADGKHLRTKLQKTIRAQKTVIRKNKR